MGLADGKVALILEVCISHKKNGLNTGCLYRSQKKGVEVKYQGSLSQPKKNPGGLYLRKKQGGGGKSGGLYLSQLSYLNNNNKIIQD